MKAISAGAKRCFINTNHPSLKGKFNFAVNKRYDESNAEYNDLIRMTYTNLLDKGQPVTLFDIELGWKRIMQTNPEIRLNDLLLSDGIHLSRQGHLLYKSIINDILVRVLENDQA